LKRCVLSSPLRSSSARSAKLTSLPLLRTQVAIRFRRKRGRPLCLILQNSHFIHDDEDGHALLHMLQQRAEAWSQAGVVTMIFLSDNFHTYAHLKRNATRMHVLSIRDLTPHETHTFLEGTHGRLYPDQPPVTKQQTLRVWDLIGGRLNYLAKVVKRDDMEEAAQALVDEEKEWLHSKLGLIPDHDGACSRASLSSSPASSRSITDVSSLPQTTSWTSRR